MKLKLILGCLTLTVSLLLGCSSNQPTQAQYDEQIKLGREAVLRIENEKNIPPETKRAMIERIEMEVSEHIGKPINLKSSPSE